MKNKNQKIIVIVWIICLIGVVFCVYMLIRNEAVYDFKTKTLYENYEEYDNYASYAEMMDIFWEWDFEKFKREIT